MDSNATITSARIICRKGSKKEYFGKWLANIEN
jgi:hypothetical protein